MRLLGCIALFATGACAASTNISAVWANDGGDKVAQDEIRATLHKENLTGKMINRTWDGHTICLYGAHNEVISFNLVLEAGHSQANNVTVAFDTLTGPNGYTIHSTAASGNGVFNWVNRPIELFYMRYLPIHGLSFFGYPKGDERQVPVRFERPWTGNGIGSGGWYNRPDHDMMYPDILVPLELVKQFNIAASKSQSVWSDIYIPKTAPAGLYSGNVIVQESGVTTYTIPVSMTVYPFTLSDTPTVKAFTNLSTWDIMQRYVAGSGGYVQWQTAAGLRVQAITDKYYELFHRHKIALIGENECNNNYYQPCQSSVPRMGGSLFTAAHGYDGPGVNVGTNIYGVGMYRSWRAWNVDTNEAGLWSHLDSFENWFRSNLPNVTRFFFLADEPTNTAQVETWAQWVHHDPGAGHALATVSTHHPVLAREDTPSLDVPVMVAGLGKCAYNKPPCDPNFTTQSAENYYLNTSGKSFWAYNDARPATGSFEIEDEGISPRELAWGQYKKGIRRWFYWYANQDTHSDWFKNPVTWGSVTYFDQSLGQFGPAKCNGNGNIVYPGTDLYNPADSYGVDGPFASLRMKEWRRGVQDVDYIALANKVNPTATQTVINNLIPKVLWEYPTQDPSYYVGPMSWSSDPDVWEAARATLAQIIGP